MAVATNVHFTLLVKMDGRLREINFRQRSVILYNVDTTDERNNRWKFDWSQEGEEWTLRPVSPDFPEWIVRNAGAIREKFLEHFL